MKFFTAITALTALVSAAFAQNAYIGAPAPGTDISPGTNVTVMVTRPDTLTGSVEVAIVLSLQSCTYRGNGTCGAIDYSDDLGQTLYLGAFHPVFDVPGDALPPHQNFTVYVPPTVPKGGAVLTLSHWSLTGAGPFDLFEIKNVTLNVV